MSKHTQRTGAPYSARARRTIVLLSLAVTAACGSSAAKSTAPTSASAPAASATGSTSAAAGPICQDINTLKQSVASLRSLPLNKNLPSAASVAASQIQQQVDKLPTDAQGKYGPQVDQVKAAAATLDTRVTAARENPNVATLAAIPTAAKGLATDLQTLDTATKGSC